MDDLLLICYDKQYLQKALDLLLQYLAFLKLMVAPEKIQRMPYFSFLGFSDIKDIQPLTFNLNSKDEYTLTELQQLCGKINWLKPFLLVPELEIRFLFSFLYDPTCTSER